MKKYLIFGVFSFWLMFHTFTYDNGYFQIGTKVWSDFGAAIPLIRSFSQGQNWPPEHPLYPGEPIRYHYLFYLLVGLLEKSGLRIDIALNTLSALGFFGLLSMIYLLSKRLFAKDSIAVVAVILFLFNSSFSFVDYFSDHGFTVDSIRQIPYQSQFASFAPWKDSKVAAFWNLNIYTNQRHLPISFAIVLLIIYLLLSRSHRPKIIIGPLMAVLMSLNQAGFLIAAIYILFSIVANPLVIPTLIASSFLSLPFLFFYLPMSHVWPKFQILHGFLPVVSQSLFWFFNLGLSIVLTPVGFLIHIKKYWHVVLPTLLIFLIANIVRLSPDAVNNHKLINFAVIIGNIFLASILVKIKVLPLRLILLVLLTLGGVFDIFPIINDKKIVLADIKKNADITFFSTLPANSRVLNSLWFYHPASLAGLPIFNGYSYFTWSYGYDQTLREQITKDIYSSATKSEACNQLQRHHITHVELSLVPEGFLSPNYSMWETWFKKIYTSPESSIRVYEVEPSCQN